MSLPLLYALVLRVNSLESNVGEKKESIAGESIQREGKNSRERRHYSITEKKLYQVHPNEAEVEGLWYNNRCS
jgi:hypothetical protein